MSTGCTCAGIGAELDLIRACVLSEKYTEVREGERSQEYIQRSDYNEGPQSLSRIRGEART